MTAKATSTSSCQLLTARDLARLLKIYIRSVWRMAGLAEGGQSDFPKALRLGPKTIRWRLADVQAYLSRLAGEGAA